MSEQDFTKHLASSAFERSAATAESAYQLQTELERIGSTPRVPTEYRYDVFTIHRPWEGCPTCGRLYRPQKDEEGNWSPPERMLPNDSDVVCPHTRRAEYLAIMRAHHHREVQIINRRVETLKNGVMNVLVEWVLIPASEKKASSPVRL